MPRKKSAAFDLKGAREMRGLSQAATAIILCSNQPSVSRWEAAGNLPEVYRKVWAQHWQLEAKANGEANRKADARSARLGRRSDKTRSRAKGNDKRDSKSPARKANRDSGLPVSDSVSAEE
jgi:hypothetical protein